jgi:ribosomal protein L44E
MVNVGDQIKCPECETIGCVVWVSQDKKTMGVKCSRSHREMRRAESKFGATVVPSTKTRKNMVFLTAVR